jgi:hypothetical protein
LRKEVTKLDTRTIRNPEPADAYAQATYPFMETTYLWTLDAKLIAAYGRAPDFSGAVPAVGDDVLTRDMEWESKG